MRGSSFGLRSPGEDQRMDMDMPAIVMRRDHPRMAGEGAVKRRLDRDKEALGVSARAGAEHHVEDVAGLAACSRRIERRQPALQQGLARPGRGDRLAALGPERDVGALTLLLRLARAEIGEERPRPRGPACRRDHLHDGRLSCGIVDGRAARQGLANGSRPAPARHQWTGLHPTRTALARAAARSPRPAGRSP